MSDKTTNFSEMARENAPIRHDVVEYARTRRMGLAMKQIRGGEHVRS
jgi:hypothetical protein